MLWKHTGSKRDVEQEKSCASVLSAVSTDAFATFLWSCAMNSVQNQLRESEMAHLKLLLFLLSRAIFKRTRQISSQSIPRYLFLLIYSGEEPDLSKSL